MVYYCCRHETPQQEVVEVANVIPNIKKIDELQSKYNLSDAELAAKIGLSRVQMWRIKKGKNPPGETFIAGILTTFKESSFNELFILIEVSHKCNGDDCKNETKMPLLKPIFEATGTEA